jgi:uncharacterized protein with PIN domain
MRTATVRFYGSLNDFLPASRRQVPFTHAFDGHPAVKDVIEALGVPHPEVDLVVANGEPVRLDRRLVDGDRLAVYPLFRSIELDSVGHLVPLPPDPPRFVLDTHLGRLAGYLRMLGFDALYANAARDDELARRASGEHRVLLTRDRGLLKRGIVALGYFVRSDDPRRQLVEIADRFDLRTTMDPFRRCLRCNGRIEPVERSAIADRVGARTLRFYATFGQCDTCGSVYWNGGHHLRMRRFIAQVLGVTASQPEHATGDPGAVQGESTM